MTQQFNQPNINSTIPRGARLITANAELNRDDDLIVVGSLGGPVGINLYDAAGVPGNIVYIKAVNGSLNPVTITAQVGESIDGLASIVLNEDLQAVVLKSNGSDWVRVAIFTNAGGGPGIVVPATIPGPFGFTSSPLPILITSVLAGLDGLGSLVPAGIGVTGQPAGDPWAFDAPDVANIVLDVETSTLEPGATLIAREPYGLGGGAQDFTYNITNVASGVNPSDPNLTRFTFRANGTYGTAGTSLIVAMGIANPSGGVNFAGYFVVENNPQP